MKIGIKEIRQKLGIQLKNKRKNDLQDTVVGVYTLITGDITSEKSIRVDGKVVGNITSPNKIIIGEKGVVIGHVEGEVVSIYGKVEGDVDTTGVLEIMPTGKLFGDVNAKIITIQEGGVFCGRSKMND